jgi:hypothetical protein
MTRSTVTIPADVTFCKKTQPTSPWDVREAKDLGIVRVIPLRLGPARIELQIPTRFGTMVMRKFFVVHPFGLEGARRPLRRSF